MAPDASESMGITVGCQSVMLRPFLFHSLRLKTKQKQKQRSELPFGGSSANLTLAAIGVSPSLRLDFEICL